MIIIYINSLVLLIGYELNVSIHSIKAMATERQKQVQNISDDLILHDRV
jgi:membrane protein